MAIPAFVPASAAPVVAPAEGRGYRIARWLGAGLAAACVLAVFFRDTMDRSGWAIFNLLPPWLVGIVVLGVPVVAPVVLSRKGYLSIPQWVIFAKLGFAVLVLGFVAAVMLGMDAERHRGQGSGEGAVVLVLAMASGLASLGCVVAAAVHPKPKA
jgi:hypothetical protein